MSITALHVLKKIRFTQVKKFIATTSIVLLLFTSYAPPAVVVAKEQGIDLVPIPSPTPEASRPVKKPIEKEYVGVLEQKKVLGLADMAFTEQSARTRLPVEVQEMEQDDFTAEQSVSVTINNPDRDTFTTKVKDAQGNETNAQVSFSDQGRETLIRIDEGNQFTPGKYTVEITDSVGTKSTQDFTWGVLALNTDKSFYRPGEKADIAIGVLDDKGDMVCNAVVELEIINNKTRKSHMITTREGQIQVNKACHSKDFTLTPDYEASYVFGEPGKYTMRLKAQTTKGEYEVYDQIEVKQALPFDIKRTSATRLYPPLEYPMLIEFTAQQDFTGTVTETVPDSFIITPADENKTYDTTKTVYLDKNDPAAEVAKHVLGAQTGGLQMPFDGHFDISQGFGSPMTDASLSNFYANYGLAGHDGIDFALPMGTPLYAVDDGNVIFSGPGDYGITIILQHSWGRSYYGHLSKTNIELNTSVKKGSLIGYSGNTGESTGPHLHFGMKPDNPDVNNGYAGKIDPMPYLSAVNGKESLIQALSLKNASAVLSATDSAVEAVPTPAGHVLQEQALNQDPAQSTTEPTKPVATPTPAKPEAPSVKAKPFTVTSDNIVAEVADSEGITNEKVKVLQWHVSLKKGEKTTLAYTYEVPKISPQFYLQGTVKVFDAEHKEVFEEGRKWQLAADSVGTDWYDKSWTYRKPITIDSTRVGNAIDPWCNDASGITCNTSWTSRKKITFANGRSGSNLTNFPVLIKLNSSRIDYADTQSDGDDLRFVDPSDNTTVLSHEIEDFDETGDDYIWVEVPQIDANSNTDYIWMYYNNAAATSGNDTANLWDSNFRTVAHFAESGDGSGYDFSDSSTFNNDYRGGGNVLANTPTRVTGSIGYAQDFDGTTDYMEGLQSAVVDATAAYTVSMWIKIDQCTTTNGAIFWKQFGANSIEFNTCYTTDYDLAMWFASSNDAVGHTYAIQKDQWMHMAAVYNGSGTMAFYVNGFPVEMSDTTFTEVASVGSNALGTSSTSSPSQLYDGMMDEVRASNTNRSANWLEAEYLTGADKFNTFGPEEDQNTNKSYTDPISSTSSWCNIATGATCNTSWSSRRKITLNNNASTTNLTNFPILVVLNSSRIDFSKTQSAGQDLRFVDANGTTLLDYEIEDFDETGNDYVWVEVPQIDAHSVTDYIWMYYGNGSASSGENATGVWDSSFEGVWHLDQNGDNVGADYLDSTSNAKHGTGGNGTAGQQPAISTSGKIGSAQTFTSNTDWITIPSITYANDLSITVWFNGGTQTASQWNYLVYSSGPVMEFGTFSDDLNWKDSVRNVNPANGDMADSTWHMATGVIDGTLMSLYIDGVLDGDLAYPGGINNGAQNFRIGGNGADKGWGGLIDEVRISDAPRSADWIYAEYITMQDRMNTFSSEETQNPGLSGGSGDAWCNDNTGITCTSSWLSRKRLNIINGGTDDTLINYPLLVKLDSTRIDTTKIQSDGDDLRFVDPSDNTTVLPHEIEGTFSSGGSNYVWVKVPHIPANSNNDWIWMYYNNAAATSGVDATNVWDSNYNITYHMDESAGNISDSAGTAQDAVRNSTTVAVGTGKVGSAQDFSSTGYLTTATPGLPTGDFSYQLWAQYDSTSDENLFATLNGSGADEARLYAYTSGLDLIVDDGGTTAATGVRNNTSNWFHYSLSRAGSKITIQRNGIQSPTIGTDADALSFSTCSLIIGADADATCTGTLGNYLDGRIDEFRVSNIARSQEWNESDFESQTDAKVTFGEEEGTATLTNFPMLINLASDSDLPTKAQLDADDILFTDSTGKTKLNHEIESYNSSTGALVAWVNLSTVTSSTDSDIYMYYGNPSVTNQESVSSVWDSSYLQVYHMDGTNGSATLSDSAGTAQNLTKLSGTSAGEPANFTSGLMNGAQDFDGTNDTANTSTSPGVPANDFTYTMWTNLDSNADGRLVSINNSGATTVFGIIIGANGSCTSGKICVDIAGSEVAESSSSLATSTWLYVVVTRNDTTGAVRVLVNNTLYASGTSTSDVTPGTCEIYLGTDIDSGCNASPSNWLNGRMDELRISNSVRSSEWLTTEYNNQSSPSSFYALGSEETYIYAPTNDELMRHGKFFDGRAAEQPFAF